MTRSRNNAIQGPDINTAFEVQSGLAVIVGTEYSFPLPAGSTWPGDRLPSDLVEAVRPVAVELMPGTTTTPEVSSSGLVCSLAHIRTVALMKGPLERRLAMLPPEMTEGCNKSTLAGAVSVTREHIIKYGQAGSTMSGRDRRQLKASLQARRALPSDPAEAATSPRPSSPSVLSDGWTPPTLAPAPLTPPPVQAAPPPSRPQVRRSDLPPEHMPDGKTDGRPLTVEYIALRLQEAVIRREGRNALDPGVTIDCISAARLLLKETRPR